MECFKCGKDASKSYCSGYGRGETTSYQSSHEFYVKIKGGKIKVALCEKCATTILKNIMTKELGGDNE